MQYLKDEVRNKIVKEALKEFKQFGYKGTSFNSKEDLYENIIGTLYHMIIDYINQFDEVELNDKAELIFYELMEKIMEIFNESSTEIAILLNKSEGSKYENCKNTFIDFVTRIVTEKMKYELSVEGKRLKDNFVIYLISYSLVESIAIILEKRSDGAEVRKLILNIIDIFYTDIKNKLDFEII
jgi:hypothetical protein